MAIRIMNPKTFLYPEETNAAPRFSTNPSMRPPATQPHSDPIPPSTTTTKAVSATGTPAVGVTGKTGARITPAAAARAQPRPKLSMLSRVVSTPFSSAISRSWLVARIIRPNQVF